MKMKQDVFRPRTHDQWELEIHRYRDPAYAGPARAPVTLFPGYGMNTFILNYHPTGTSMVEYLVGHGFEVWTANMRGQGGARYLGRGDGTRYGFRELALFDMPLVYDVVLEQTTTGHDQFHVIGCSLGATVAYAYLAHHRFDHDFRTMVALGGPLRWEAVHPLMRVAFSSATVAGLVPMKGTRFLAKRLLPIVEKTPQLLSIYMNAGQIDLSKAADLVQTVDDPNPYLNRQIAHWVREKDLEVAGVNVTRAMGDISIPLLCMHANRDGIVPSAAARSILDHVASQDVTAMEVGDDEKWYAHADLFIAKGAEQKVFAPLADWLLARDPAA